MTCTTQNESYGFWGTMHLEGKNMAEQAWPLASEALAAATGEDAESIRAFLDSRWGRHFADGVHNGLFQGKTLPDAISATTERWMRWRLSRSSRRKLCIPKGVDGPYLTLLVMLAAIEDGVV